MYPAACIGRMVEKKPGALALAAPGKDVKFPSAQLKLAVKAGSPGPFGGNSPGETWFEPLTGSHHKVHGVWGYGFLSPHSHPGVLQVTTVWAPLPTSKSTVLEPSVVTRRESPVLQADTSFSLAKLCQNLLCDFRSVIFVPDFALDSENAWCPFCLTPRVS